MRVIDNNEVSRPTLVSAVKFDPWPFTGSSVEVAKVRLLSVSGRIDPAVIEVETLTIPYPWLGELSDGTYLIGYKDWDGRTLVWLDE